MSARSATLVVLLLAATTLVPAESEAQAGARWVRSGADSGCTYGTRRRADGNCHGVRRVPLELTVEGVKASDVWLAMRAGAASSGFDPVPVAESPSAHTRAVGRLHVVKSPRKITITAAVRDPRIGGHCRDPRVVATTGMVSDVHLGAMITVATRALMDCFDEQWTVAGLGRSR
ncbi:MAG TPA: hypothetical protein VEA99_12600 [Gemmatimonadaceae bacterium]|nr:hypothetical protein [Gemmatimonadaceae bacterium]